MITPDGGKDAIDVLLASKQQSQQAQKPSHYPANKILHVGNRYAHPSHKLKNHRGLVYCARCGCRATNQMRLMGNRCVPPGVHGRASLKAILADKLPPGLVEWPD